MVAAYPPKVEPTKKKDAGTETKTTYTASRYQRTFNETQQTTRKNKHETSTTQEKKHRTKKTLSTLHGLMIMDAWPFLYDTILFLRRLWHRDELLRPLFLSFFLFSALLLFLFLLYLANIHGYQPLDCHRTRCQYGDRIRYMILWYSYLAALSSWARRLRSPTIWIFDGPGFLLRLSVAPFLPTGSVSLPTSIQPVAYWMLSGHWSKYLRILVPWFFIMLYFPLHFSIFPISYLAFHPRAFVSWPTGG